MVKWLIEVYEVGIQVINCKMKFNDGTKFKI